MLKLARADEHLDSLQTEIQWWAASHPYRISREREPESGFTVLYAEPLAEPPPKLSAIVSDVLQNLRACLEYLALALAERNHGPLSEGETRASFFPVCETPEKFAAALTGGIRYVAAGPRAVIERAQPYHRGDDWESDRLAILKTLSDLDKHRRLPLVAQHAQLSPDKLVLNSEHWQAAELEVTFPRSFETKTELFRSRGLTDPTGSEVDVDASLTVNVAFSERGPAVVANESAHAVLDALWRHVATEVVLPLKPYLE